MGFFGNAAGRIRGLLRWDKERVALSLAKGNTGSGTQQTGFDIMSSYGNDQLAEYLKLEQDLMSRYVDIEEMDEFSETSSALDFYADDACSVDQLNGKSVWVDSDDRTVKEIITDLFDKRLRLGEECWSQTRTTCKYGQDYEEVLVTEDGVVGLNHLPPPTMRRIEGRRGELFGFVQDYKGRFASSPDEFKQLLAQRSLSGNSSGDPGLNNVVALEDWEVVHFRLRNKKSRAIYGDCLAGGSKVWTVDGPKDIRDVKTGDMVFLRDSGRLRTAMVGEQVCSGTKEVFKLKTKHREIVASANHPFLADRDTKNVWVKLGDLRVGDKIVLANKMPASAPAPAFGIRLNGLTEESDVTLTDRGSAAVRHFNRIQKYMPKDYGLRVVAEKIDITVSLIDEITNYRSSIKLSKLRQLFSALEIPLFDGSFKLKLQDERLNLPDFVDAKICRLFGFLLGDGWITDGQIYFARGTDETQNEYYENALGDLGLPVSYGNGKEQAYVSSEALCVLFRELGWIDGAHNKRVPGWVFAVDEEYRKEFIEGFMDADGHRVDGSFRIELCNKELVEDIKTLIDGLGWQCGNVHKRTREAHIIKAGTPRALWDGKFVLEDKLVKESTAYYIYWSKNEIPSTCGDGAFSESILSIESLGKDSVYDIEIKHEGHNFIANGMYVHNSVLDPVRWLFKRLVLLEDSALVYQLQRSPQRFVYTIDTGDLPPREAFAFLNKVRNQYKKTKYINPTCLTADTCITCLDGVERSIGELAKDYADKQFWVFSYDLKKGKVVPGKASGPRKTGEMEPIWRVILDNGAAIRCTGNHPFLMRDGEYKAANTLVAGDSVMPMYLSRGSEGTHGYWMYGDPKTGKREFVHQMVAREIYDADYKNKKLNAHHIDHNKSNNSPDNLKLLTKYEHAIEHPERVAAARRAFVERIENDKEFADEIGARLINWQNNNPELARENAKNAGSVSMAARKSAATAGHVKMMSIIETEVVRDPLVMADELVDRLNANVDFLETYKSLPTTTKSNISLGCFNAFISSQGYSGFRDLKIQKTGQYKRKNKTYGGRPTRERQNRDGYNHKVISVTFVGYEDVYNLDVEDYHNFALTAGVFVHNTGKIDLKYNVLSPDEDIFIASRQGNQSAKVDVLNSPMWQSSEMLEYFRLKMFAGLKVPKTYLGFGDAVGKGSLSSEDVRFAKAVLRVQREMRDGYSKIARIHLAALNINPASVDYEIYMTVPSAVFELAQLEVRNAKADFAGRMSQFVSLHWILNKVFGLSDEEIQYITKERHEEQLADAEIQAKAMGMNLQVQGNAQVQQAAQQQQMAGAQPASAGGQASGQNAQEGSGVSQVMGSLSQLWPQRRQLHGYRPITEKELFVGNRDHEKRVEDNFEKMFKQDAAFANRISEIRELVHELRMTKPGR